MPTGCANWLSVIAHYANTIGLIADKEGMDAAKEFVRTHSQMISVALRLWIWANVR